MANELNKVNSSGIEDGSIVNADIKSDAAIALSKLASTPAVLTGSTDNTICTVTGANAIQGETNVRIDSSGRLLTGGQTTSVADASSLHADIQSHSADGNGLSIGRYANNAYDPYITFFKSRNTTIGSNGTLLQDGDTIGTLTFYGATGSAWDHVAYHSVKVDGTPGASNDMPVRYDWHNQADGQQHPTYNMSLRANGDLEVKTGNLVIGTSGKGIDFSAVSHAGGMTSELLDSYEEGTYTPTLSAVVNSYALQYGFYTKIGNVVHFSIWIKVSSIGSNNTNTLQVSLPFTSKNISNYRGSGTFTGESLTFDTAYTGVNRTHIGHNTSMMDMSFGFKSDFDAGWHTGVIKNNNTDNETAFQISGTYLAD